MHCRCFAVAGARFYLRTNDGASLHLLDTAYAPLQRDDGRGPVRARACIERDGNTLRVSLDDREVRVRRPSGDSFVDAYYATQELFARFAAAVDGWIALYGAAVRIGERGVILLGPSEIGKSVLALHLVSLGAAFLGDETVFVSTASARLRALPRLPVVREPALPLIPEQTRARIDRAPFSHGIRGARLWYALRPADLLGIAPDASPYRLDAFVAIEGRSDRAALAPVEGADLLSTVSQRAYGGLQSLSTVAALRASLGRARCYRLRLGEPRESAQVLMGEFA